jgi:hypothetical protein
MTEKARILQEIRRVATRNGGKAPGVAAFERATGIRNSDWFPHLWLRWSDAIAEAGLAANKMQEAYATEYLVQRFVAFIQELGHIPVKGELLRKSKTDKSFPNEKVFYKGGKNGLLKRVLAYCEGKPDLQDVMARCTAELEQSQAVVAEKKTKTETGFVYLMRSGKHYKIGLTVSVGSRERQLAIQIPVPPRTIHSIETDDPRGVETYWHRRFAEKRGEGEWFDLTAEDVAAFKRWKRIV